MPSMNKSVRAIDRGLPATVFDMYCIILRSTFANARFDLAGLSVFLTFFDDAGGENAVRPEGVDLLLDILSAGFPTLAFEAPLGRLFSIPESTLLSLRR